MGTRVRVGLSAEAQKQWDALGDDQVEVAIWAKLTDWALGGDPPVAIGKQETVRYRMKVKPSDKRVVQLKIRRPDADTMEVVSITVGKAKKRRG